MSNASPWDSIKVPIFDLNVRQVDRKTAVPCFWARNADGACLFVLELDGDYRQEYHADYVPIHGVVLDLRTGQSGKQNLLLRLERQHDRDLFASLCEPLSAALEHATDSSTALDIALQHLRRWKAFLAGKTGLLSGEEIQGLFAELTFLDELLEHDGDQGTVLQAWLGPEHSHQDFIYGDTAVEVKSLSGRERSAIRISSEDQLETQQASLFLRLYRLSVLPDSVQAQSLNDKVTSIQQRLSDSEAIETFNSRLVLHGYAPLPAYDQPKFMATGIRTFRVTNEFPRLARSSLPEGITRVAYDLKLEAIAPYECNDAEAVAGI